MRRVARRSRSCCGTRGSGLRTRNIKNIAALFLCSTPSPESRVPAPGSRSRTTSCSPPTPCCSPPAPLRSRRCSQNARWSSPIASRRSKILALIIFAGFVVLLALGPLTEATWIERGFSATLIVATIVLLAFLTRRLIFAFALPVVLFGGVLISSYMKFHYLTTPLLAPDLVYFVNRDLLEVATRYPPIMIAIITAAILIPGIIVLAWRWDRPMLLARVRMPQRRWLRWGGVALALVVLGLAAWPRGPFAGVFEKGMWQAMNDKSYITDFYTSFYQTQIIIPPFVKDEESALLWTQPDAENPPACAPPACIAAKPLKEAQEHPDIVAVLEESTYDPTMLKVCKLPEVCKRKLFAPDGRTRAHGLLTVHVWGGGTWTSEFALMSGLDHLTFGDAGLYARYTLA